MHGRSAAEALRYVGENASAVEGASAGDASPLEALSLTLTRRAMACEFQVRLNTTAEQNDSVAAMAALDVVERVEDRLTVYRDESEVQDLNRHASRGPAAVAPDLFELLLLTERLYRETTGAYDITSGPLSKAWGFSRRAGRVPSEDELREALARVGWSHVRVDNDAMTIEFTRPGMEINFNSAGKGFALDRAAECLAERGAADFIINGGRSTLVARGRQADGDPDGVGWGVGIRHPLRPERRLAECRLVDAAFSSSGSGTQCFVTGGKRYGHLIDPRTGWPAEGLHSVSVVAPTGAEADALSTAFYVMGYEAAEAYCQSQPGLQACFVLPGKSAGSVEVRGVGLDAECWRLADAE